MHVCLCFPAVVCVDLLVCWHICLSLMIPSLFEFCFLFLAPSLELASTLSFCNDHHSIRVSQIKKFRTSSHIISASRWNGIRDMQPTTGHVRKEPGKQQKPAAASVLEASPIVQAKTEFKSQATTSTRMCPHLPLMHARCPHGTPMQQAKVSCNLRCQDRRPFPTHPGSCHSIFTTAPFLVPCKRLETTHSSTC